MSYYVAGIPYCPPYESENLRRPATKPHKKRKPTTSITMPEDLEFLTDEPDETMPNEKKPTKNEIYLLEYDEKVYTNSEREYNSGVEYDEDVLFDTPIELEVAPAINQTKAVELRKKYQEKLDTELDFPVAVVVCIEDKEAVFKVYVSKKNYKNPQLQKETSFEGVNVIISPPLLVKPLHLGSDDEDISQFFLSSDLSEYQNGCNFTENITPGSSVGMIVYSNNAYYGDVGTIGVVFSKKKKFLASLHVVEKLQQINSPVLKTQGLTLVPGTRVISTQKLPLVQIDCAVCTICDNLFIQYTNRLKPAKIIMNMLVFRWRTWQSEPVEGTISEEIPPEINAELITGNKIYSQCARVTCKGTWARQGDSGAIVTTRQNGESYLVGIVCAGIPGKGNWGLVMPWEKISPEVKNHL